MALKGWSQFPKKGVSDPGPDAAHTRNLLNAGVVKAASIVLMPLAWDF
jgi:hypothetical protein